MRLLGIDPGASNIGWAFITTEPLTHVKHGTHHLEYEIPEAARMGLAYRFIHDQIVYFGPDVVVVEDVFLHGCNYSAKDVIKVIALVQLACDDRGVACELLSPSEWQSRIIRGKVARDRAARKLQVGAALRGLIQAPVSLAGKAEHENDAIGIALAYTLPAKEKPRKKTDKAHRAVVKQFEAKRVVEQG